MKINSGTFLSYLQLKESNDFDVVLNEKPEQESNNSQSEKSSTNTGTNYKQQVNPNLTNKLSEMFLTGEYDIIDKFTISNGNIIISNNKLEENGLYTQSEDELPKNIEENIKKFNISKVISINVILEFLKNTVEKNEDLQKLVIHDNKSKPNKKYIFNEQNEDIFRALQSFINDFYKSITDGDSKIRKNIILAVNANEANKPILFLNKLEGNSNLSSIFNTPQSYNGIIINNCKAQTLNNIKSQAFTNKMDIIAVQDCPDVSTIGINNLTCSCKYVSLRNTGVKKITSILPTISDIVEQFVVEDNDNLITLDGAPAKCKQIKINNNKNIFEWNWDPTDVEYAQIRNNGDGNDAYNKFITSLTENNKKLEDGKSLITDTSFFEVSEDKKTCTLNTQLTSADLSNERIFEISKDTASFRYKTEFSGSAKQNLLFGTTIKRNEYTNSENIDGIELGSFINFPAEKIDGTIDVSGNTKISSFEGITPIIGGDLLLSECREITNLEFFPKQIGGNLDLSNCKKLTELGKTFVDRDYAIQVGGILNVTNTPLFDKITELLPNGKQFTDFFDVKGKIVGNDKLGSNNQNTEKITANSDGTYTCNTNVGFDDLIKYVEGYDAKTNKATGKKFKVEFKEAKGDFDISGLPITSLEGCPKKVTGRFIRREGNFLKGKFKPTGASTSDHIKSDLALGPSEVSIGYYIPGCKDITSLKGCPNKVQYFWAAETGIKNLEGGPEEATEWYIVTNCEKLESLKGLPSKTKEFDISGCENIKDDATNEKLLKKAKTTGIDKIKGAGVIQGLKNLANDLLDLAGGTSGKSE